MAAQIFVRAAATLAFGQLQWSGLSSLRSQPRGRGPLGQQPTLTAYISDSIILSYIHEKIYSSVYLFQNLTHTRIEYVDNLSLGYPYPLKSIDNRSTCQTNNLKYNKLYDYTS
jgi:hypothetical protein